MRAYLIRAGAHLAGYVLAWCIVLGLGLVACSVIVPGHPREPAAPPVAPSASGMTWEPSATVQVEDRRPTPSPSAAWEPSWEPSWDTTAPDDTAPDLDALCAELEAPEDVPECVDLGYDD